MCADPVPESDQTHLLSAHLPAWDPRRSHELRGGLGPILAKGADFLLWALVDDLVDSYFPLLEVYGERVETPEQLARWVLATPPGREVTLVWARGGIGYSGNAVLRESRERVPHWLAGADTDASADRPRRVAELDREMRRLTRELTRIKEQSGSSPR